MVELDVPRTHSNHAVFALTGEDARAHLQRLRKVLEWQLDMFCVSFWGGSGFNDAFGYQAARFLSEGIRKVQGIRCVGRNAKFSIAIGEPNVEVGWVAKVLDRHGFANRKDVLVGVLEYPAPSHLKAVVEWLAEGAPANVGLLRATYGPLPLPERRAFAALYKLPPVAETPSCAGKGSWRYQPELAVEPPEWVHADTGRSCARIEGEAAEVVERWLNLLWR